MNKFATKGLLCGVLLIGVSHIYAQIMTFENVTGYPVSLKIDTIGSKDGWEDIERALDKRIELKTGEQVTIYDWQNYALRGLNVEVTIKYSKKDVQIKRFYKEIYNMYKVKQQKNGFALEASNVENIVPALLPMP